MSCGKAKEEAVDWRKEICLNGLRGLGIWE